MPPGLPQRPPLAMRFWLFRRSKGNASVSAAAAHSHSSGYTMSIEFARTYGAKPGADVPTPHLAGHNSRHRRSGRSAVGGLLFHHRSRPYAHCRRDGGRQICPVADQSNCEGPPRSFFAGRSDAELGGNRSGDQQGRGRSRGPTEQSGRLGELAGGRHCASERDGFDRAAAALAKPKGGDNGAVAATAAKATKSAGSKSAAASKPAKSRQERQKRKESDGDDSDTSDDSSDSDNSAK